MSKPLLMTHAQGTRFFWTARETPADELFSRRLESCSTVSPNKLMQKKKRESLLWIQVPPNAHGEQETLSAKHVARNQTWTWPKSKKKTSQILHGQ